MQLYYINKHQKHLMIIIKKLPGKKENLLALRSENNKIGF